MEHLNYIIQTYPQVEGYVISIKHNLSQGFIQDFAFGGGPGSMGEVLLSLEKSKISHFFQPRKFSKNVKKSMKIL